MRFLAIKIGLLLSVIFTIVFMFGWDLLEDMERLQHESSVVERSNQQSHVLHDIEMGVYANMKVIKDFLVARNDGLESDFIAANAQLADKIADYESAYQDEALSHLSQSMAAMQSKAFEIFHLKFSEGSMEAPILAEEIETMMQQALNQLSNKHHDLDAMVNRAMQMVEGLRMDMRNDMIALLIVLLVSLISLTYFIYKYIVLPLVQMKGAVEQVGSGDFDIHCQVRTQDEIGDLASAFNTMGTALQDRESKLNRLRSLAAHQEKMNALDIMSASIAHEVGNPLAAMAVLLQTSKRKLKQQDCQAVEQHIDLALKESERMETIIQTALNFGRSELGERLAPFDVQTAIQDAVRLVQMSPQHKRVAIHVDIDAKIPLAWGSASMLMQVLMNIIYNACHACGSGGKIRIHVYEQKTNMMIDICDTGQGIAQDVRAEIFHPSFTTKGKTEGSGFGLAISRELMDAMHGTLKLLDDTNQGTCFQISLPKAKETEVIS